MTALTVKTPQGELAEVVDAPRLLAAFGVEDLDAASTVELATADDALGLLLDIGKEARGMVSDHLVDHLDSALDWSLAVDGFEVKAPSPIAGTSVYDDAMLDALLCRLIAEGRITQRAADKVRVPNVPAASVPFGLLRDLASALDGHRDQATHYALAHELELILRDEPAPTFRTDLRGVAALAKLPGLAEEVEACKVAVPAPRRTAKVRRVAKAAA
jgi:hypothetical protein